jgi:4-hydroxybenzoate polyprenyltransferase
MTENDDSYQAGAARLNSWTKALRIHQWSKNFLLLLPAALSHRIVEPQVLIESALAFFSFSLCSSSVYVINDLIDLRADQAHPSKRYRPFAAGELSARAGRIAALILILAAIGLALAVGYRFVAVLCGYYFITWIYSLKLKRIALIDMMTLAALYTLRIIAGSAATGIVVSFWLLAFSIFIFLSLAAAKRYAEVSVAAEDATSNTRGYTASDLPFLLAVGMAAGYCTVVVMAVYINSGDSVLLYQNRKPLWLVCPLLLYWISRVWLVTTRGKMLDDPVVFALRDPSSWVILGGIALLLLISL